MPKVGQPTGYVTKDGRWAAVPSNGRKFAIVHNGIVEHFSKNFECAMIYIKKGIQKGEEMHDQNSIDTKTPAQKYQRALDLFTESVMKPDHRLRGCAYNQGVLMNLWNKEHVLEYLKT